MYKSSLCIHQVKLLVQANPGCLDCGGVGEAADGTVQLGQISSRNDGWRLIINSHLLETITRFKASLKIVRN